ncbi:MAG: PD-(D/E)XK nuclease family protein [Bacteroidia bacterium]|nr:PD-(D/E)XK nuclease family protein [Bacteroidia bacterium]
MELKDPIPRTAEEIQQQITELFDYNPLPRTEYAPDLFSLSGFPHYEDVLSNWYAFFFRTEEKHGFGRLFVQALLDVIRSKTSDIPGSFMDHRVQCKREVQTKKGNYIDLVLYDEENDVNSFNQSILIENKVYHILHNDLIDYYDSIKTKAGEHKQGVLMTLWPLGDLPPGYVNITHREFIGKVLSLLPQYWGGSGEKYLIYLKDIEQNIQRLTSEMQMNTNIRFYIENTSKFHAMQEVAREACEFIYGQIEATAYLLKLEPDGKQYDYRHIWQRGVDHVYYTVLLTDFFKDGKTIHVALELWTKKALDLMASYNTACEDVHVGKDVIVKPSYDGKSNFHYYAFKTYTIEPDQIENLSEILATGIKEDMEPIRKAITAVYTTA